MDLMKQAGWQNTGGGIPEHAVHHGKNLCAVCTWAHPCCGPGAAAWPCCWSGSRGRCTPSSTGPPLRTLLGSTGYMYSNKLYFFYYVFYMFISFFLSVHPCVSTYLTDPRYTGWTTFLVWWIYYKLWLFGHGSYDALYYLILFCLLKQINTNLLCICIRPLLFPLIKPYRTMLIQLHWKILFYRTSRFVSY